MRKFYLLLVVALLATSSAFADITYVLNEGYPNPYGWNSKDDMFRAFMQVALEKTEVKELSAYLTDEENDPVTAIAGDLYDTDGTRINRGLSDSKFGWLKTYIMTFQNAQKAAGYDASELKETITASHQAYRFAVAAFFAKGKFSSWPKTADFTEAGKDEAYLPTWEYCYAFPTTVTETTTLKKPWKENCTFDGWYKTADFSGTAVTEISADFTGTLYAKWINNVFYELNGGAWNPYGWNSKEDLFNAFMADAGVTNAKSYNEYKDIQNSQKDPYISTGAAGNQSLGSILKSTNIGIPYANTEKWGWLHEYIKKVAGIADLSTNPDNTGVWRYATAQFLIEGTGAPYSYDFTEAGKDEAYFKAWGYSYGNPSIIEGEYTLKNPYREGAWEFAGWYKNAECTGEPTTTINADFAGTLYAKWNSVREGITYDLNGGAWNPYGWTSKADMFKAFMQVALEKTEVTTLSSYKASGTDAAVTAIAGDLWDNDGTRINRGLSDSKFEWLKTYVMTFQNAQIAAGYDASELKETITASHQAYRFAVAAFFAEGKRSSAWPKSADFTEAGKDEAYFPAWGYSYESINPKFPEAEFTLHAAVKEGCTFQGWYDNRWFTGEAVTTVGATTNGTLYAHWSSIMSSENTTLKTLHTHYWDGTYVYASTIDNMGSNKNLYNSDKAGEYFSDKAANFAQEDWVAIADLGDEYVNKELTVGTAFEKVANTDFPVIRFTAAADPQDASARELNSYRVANFNIYADNAHVKNIWLVAPQAGEYCHLTGYVKAVSGNVVTLAASDKEDDAVEMTVNIAKLSAKSAVVAGAWYKFTGIVVNGDKALTFNATSSEDVSTGVEEAEIGSTIVRGMNGEIAVSVASPATVNVYTAGGALVATRNIADSDAIAVAPGFYIVKADNTVVKVLVK